MKKSFDLDRVAEATFNLAAERRSILKSVGIGVAGLAIGGVAEQAIAQAVVPAQGVNDVNIQRFGLNFEYLGAELYLRALGQPGLPTAMVVGPRG